jgi:hypothetical protein
MAQGLVDDGVVCGIGDPANAERAVEVEKSFAANFTGAPSGHFALLTPIQVAAANTVFGTSLDFRGVYLSDFAGVKHRGLTIAFSLPRVVQIVLSLPAVYIMSCGTFDPKIALLIHELTHVWQSQHHQDPSQYLRNSLESHAQAKIRNLGMGSSDDLFPFSPDAYVPGKAFSDYGAEQIAKQVEKGVAPIVAHVASVAMAARDTGNELGLATARVEDKRAPGVQF